MNVKHICKPGWRPMAASVLLALALTACASFNGDADEAAAKAELIALQDAWVAAEIAGDAEALRALMDERMLTTYASGETVDREGYIDWIVNLDVKPFVVELDRIELHGDTAVMISHIVDGRTKISWVAMRKNGRWLGVEQTFTRMEDAP